jgi:hypothetical protein
MPWNLFVMHGLIRDNYFFITRHIGVILTFTLFSLSGTLEFYFEVIDVLLLGRLEDESLIIND